jgi:hypothetical protein
MLPAELDASFFRVRFDRLTPTEKRYLRAMADLGLGPHRSGDIAERMGRKVEGAAPIRNKRCCRSRSVPTSRPSIRLRSRLRCARQLGHRYRLRRRAIDSGPFSSLVTGKVSRSSSALRIAGLSEIARVLLK